MREHDILILPSLFEGYGLVISEAMSQGTPVIATDRTAGGDFIVHGENGWLVQAGSTDGIVEILDYLITTPSEVEKCGRSALLTASKRPWSIYGSELANKISSIIL
jgi:glycosyltransferase involved in cell wall biosynthesis